MANQTPQQEVFTLRADVRKLEKIVAMLVRRLGTFEKQMRSMKARAQQAGLNIDALERARKTPAPYSPPTERLY